MAETCGEGKKGRKRSSNFTHDEKVEFLTIISKHKNTIECKQTDGVSSKLKNQMWNTIATEFNAKEISPDYPPADKLKLLWENLKRTTRKHYSELRQETFKTGGGTNPIKENPFYHQIKEIISSTVDPLENEFDDDALPEESDRVVENTENNLENLQFFPVEVIDQSNILLDRNGDYGENDTEPISQKETQDWSEWNPNMLRKEKNSILKIPSNSSLNTRQISGSQNSKNILTSTLNLEQVTDQVQLDNAVRRRLPKKTLQ